MKNQFPEISKINRQKALENGEKTYLSGTPCKKCGGLEKTVGGYSCVVCRKERGLKKLNDVSLMAKYRTKEKQNEKQKKWRANNPEKLREQRQRVKIKQNGYQQKRRALLRNQFPDDADLNLIQEFYRMAELKTKETGIPYEVDHIIPISKGGLHHQNNLQVITRTENRSKSNKII
jgi:5-methylcytosine-specific restriction endonuclease McrA